MTSLGKRFSHFTLSIVAVLVVIVIATRTPATGSVEATAALVWQRCGALECSTLEVPLDYAKPDDRRVSLALIRQTAKEPSRRIGSLVVNPGGPGGSGVDFVRSVAPFFPREVQNRFDIVGFDPRGVGQSSPLLCHDNLLELAGLDPSPDSPDEVSAIVAETKEFVDLCVQRAGDQLAFFGTRSTVQDLDLIRAALGDAGLTYLGFSYGTVIGQLYADRFPQNSRALVLDGAVDLSLAPEDLTVQQLRAFEGAFEHFLADCRARGCLSTGKGDPDAAVKELLRRAEAEPIASDFAGRPAGPAEVVLAMFSALYSEGQWPKLARAIEEGLDGDGSGLVELMDEYLRKRPDGTFDNWFEVFNAVSCLDYELPRTMDAYSRFVAGIESRTARFSDVNFGSWLPCVYWPVPAQPLEAPSGRGAPPVLVIGTTGDPATPYAWAVSLAEQLESATLLTNNGEGHTAYLGSTCINDAVNLYLIDLIVPAEGAACGDPARATPIDISDARPAVSEPTAIPNASTGDEASPTEQPPAGAPPLESGPDGNSDSNRSLLIVLGVVAAAAGGGTIALFSLRRSRKA